MYTIVFDLEWNMPGFKNRVPLNIREAIPFEIIEIGAVKLNHRLEIVDSFSQWIKPAVYKVLDKHVSEVTGRTLDSLDEGLPFPEVMEAFYAWADQVPVGSDTLPEPLAAMPQDVHDQAETHRYFFATWSNSDTGPLRDNLRYHHMSDELPARCLNIQKLYTKLFEEGSGQQRSIAYALETLSIPTRGEHHRSLTDAQHTGLILQALAAKMEEPETLQEGEAGDFPTIAQGLHQLERLPIMDRLWSYTYNPNLTYQSRDSIGPAMKLQEVGRILDKQAWNCPHCDMPMLEVRPWRLSKEAANAKTYVARYQCADHGRVIGTIRIRRGKEGTWFGQYTFRLHRPLEL